MTAINVTQEDIDESRRLINLDGKDVLAQCCVCPVAIAATRAFGFEVTVGRNFINERRSGRSWVLPNDARARILRFDLEDVMEPFVFEAELLNS